MSTNSTQLRREIIRFLSEHWSEDCSISYLSSLFGYTERYFKQIFKKMFGLPFGSYLTKLRIHRAALMIKKNYSIMEAGEMYVDYILEHESEGGGWSLAGGPAEVDLTAMVLQALAKYQDRQDVAEATIELLMFCPVCRTKTEISLLMMRKAVNLYLRLL